MNAVLMERVVSGVSQSFGFPHPASPPRLTAPHAFSLVLLGTIGQWHSHAFYDNKCGSNSTTLVFGELGLHLDVARGTYILLILYVSHHLLR